VSKAGEICVNTLKKDWKPAYGIGHVLQVVRCLLINPFPESALNDEAGKLFMEEYDAYFKKAQMMTEVHARTAASLAGEGPSGGGEPGPLEKRQKPVESKEAEKRRQEKKKSLKRL
jgi:ubiquitin-conjugating enzyme E2 S